jgi:hypothetical protein
MLSRKGEKGKMAEKRKLLVTTEKSFLWVYNKAALLLGPSL